MSRILVNEPKPRMVAFSDIITPAEVKSLRAALKVTPGDYPHIGILAWLKSSPDVLARWAKLELLPDYGAYLLEYHLGLGGGK